MPPQPTTGGVSSLVCEVCGAAVAPDQRYCVECGNHRVGVHDPAASFMNRPTAQGGVRAARAVVVSSRRSRWLSALALVLIPVAIAVGILIGRSTNNQDQKIINALKNEKAQVVTVQSAASKVVTVGSGAAVGATKAKSTSKSKTKSKSTTTSQSTSTHKASGAVGAKSSASQAKQSAKIVKKLQSTSGLSYLDPLPSQVGG